MNIKKYYIKSHRCLWLCLLALSSNSVMAVACKTPMPVHKFWRVGMLSHISPSIIQNVNNGLGKRSLCQKSTYVVPQEEPYVNKYTIYNTMKWNGAWWHHPEQQHRYAFNIQLAIGIGATVGLYCSMGHCEAAPHNNAPVLPALPYSLDPVFRDLEKEAGKSQQYSFGFFKKEENYSFVEKIVRKWAKKRLSIADTICAGTGFASGGYKNVDLGILLRYAAKEGSYIVCWLMIAYAKYTGHKLSMNFYTLYNPYTPLDYAAVGGCYRVVKLLLKNGSISVSRNVRTYIRENDSSIDNLLKKYNV